MTWTYTYVRTDEDSDVVNEALSLVAVKPRSNYPAMWLITNLPPKAESASLLSALFCGTQDQLSRTYCVNGLDILEHRSASLGAPV